MVPNAVTTSHYCQIQLRPGDAVTPPHSGSRAAALIAVEGMKPSAPAFYNTHK